MNSYADKINKQPGQKESKSTFQLQDNRSQSAIQKKQVDALANKQSTEIPVQRKANTTGLPDQLKSGIENLSGHSMDDVKVHYNSSKPTQLNAHAYAQGTDIHLASGQEKHLPHEAWHVVQQKQGRVKPTMQMKGKVDINDDKGLEKEADVMGGKAVQLHSMNSMAVSSIHNNKVNNVTVQRKISVAEEIYPKDDDVRLSKRDFRRKLMLALKANDFKDLGTKKMWAELEVELNKPGRILFQTWAALTNSLWDAGFLTRNLKGGSMGPKNLGSRPVFSQATQDALPVNGQHRRHIISSSTLGKGIEKAYELVKKHFSAKPSETLELLNQWIEGNKGEAKTSEYAALREIWTLVHNHQGNLWVGQAAFNSAIGFIRTPLSALKDKYNGMGYTELEPLLEDIKKIQPSMKFLESAWNEIMDTMIKTVSMAEPVISSVGLISAYINWSEEMKELEQTEDYAPAHKIYDELDKKLFGNSYSVSVVLRVLNKIVSQRKFAWEKRNLPIYSKWIEKYGFPGKYISKSTVHELLVDWIRNCDLDYPYNLIEAARAEYFDELAEVYMNILSPDIKFFDNDSTLEKFMKLYFKK
ncbi:MAG: hypothetical protein JWO44_1330 [Bacteroidetes bacterium]|nr:hypothetical protein [Bacteroidota bacterium]